ncbi:1278_t:CDS:2 [Entrophospora sp. SA101]|nr:1278_t:CDS:2 [Entrophospora sp. SA101]
MSHQTFLFSPKFSKKPIYDSPTNKYQEFSNAYVYSIMVKTGNGTPNRADICREATQEWNRIKKKSTTEIDEIIRRYLITQFNLYDIQTMRPRYPIPREDLTPLPTTIRLVEPTPEIPVNAAAQKKVANGITIAEKKLTEFEQIYNFTTDSQLRHDMHKKKQKLLLESQEIILYDKPGRPPLLFQHPDLHDHIHDSVEFGSADEKRRKEVVKVRIIKNLPWVAVAGVSCAETRDHPNGHYCLASVKCAKQFATVFADMSVVISQDDKAKIGLGVPAVGRTFHTLQSVHEPVCVADHDFPVGNLESLTLDPQYDDVLKTNGEIRPIWVLLVDGGPDENLRHLKNIKTYCQLFRKFDLDYLTVRTHAPGQSKYNPVERGMATLSGKLAGITLPIDHYGTHLNIQGKVINPDLALQNFRYAGEALCNIWHHDLIFGKSVDARYVEELVNPFENLQFEVFHSVIHTALEVWKNLGGRDKSAQVLITQIKNYDSFTFLNAKAATFINLNGVKIYLLHTQHLRV